MRVVFVRVHDPERPYQWLMPPLGIGYLIAVLKRQAPRHEYLYVRTLDDALAAEPDLLALSSATENFHHAEAWARQFKEATGRPVIIGGMHITSLPHTLPEAMDVAVVGEGEPVIADLVELFAAGRAAPSELSRLGGVAFHDGDAVVVRPPRLLVEDLDTLPWPDRAALGAGWAWPSHRVVHMISSRGCPYDCAFCSSGRAWTRYRAFSAPYLIDEIERLRALYDPEEIFFFDDLFIASRSRFQEFCRLLRERDLHEGVRFRAYARANLIDPALVDLFEENHFQFIDFGFESNCERTLRYLNKQGVTPESNQRALDLMRGRNISVGANMIVGSPDETLEEMEESYQFIARNRDQIDRMSVGPLMTMPGTRVWHEAAERGLVNDRMDDWTRMRFDPHNWDPQRYVYLNRVLPLEDFAAFVGRFIALQDEINQRGEQRKQAIDARFREERYLRVKSRLDTLQGSRLVRWAMGAQQWAKRIPRGRS